MKQVRREQRPKNYRVERVQGLRSSGAAGPHRADNEYRRLSRHEIWEAAIEELEELED